MSFNAENKRKVKKMDKTNTFSCSHKPGDEIIVQIDGQPNHGIVDRVCFSESSIWFDIRFNVKSKYPEFIVRDIPAGALE